MKELSIEQKAKAYDKALKLIKECTPDENGFITIYPQEIFPELKENEDEKIRKELIRAFKSLNTIKVWNGIERTDILAWLEKQSEKDEEILVLKDQIESLHAAIKAIKETHRIELERQGKEEYALKSFKDEDVRKFMQCIEKQAKAYEFNLPNRSYDIYAFAKDLLVWLEKQGEHYEKYKCFYESE